MGRQSPDIDFSLGIFRSARTVVNAPRARRAHYQFARTGNRTSPGLTWVRKLIDAGTDPVAARYV
jgi:hypothetical protein